MKKIFGAILITGLSASAATAMDQKVESLVSKTERNVVRIDVKDSKIKANYKKFDQRHLTRVYSPKSAPTKIIKPRIQAGVMPNLYKK